MSSRSLTCVEVLPRRTTERDNISSSLSSTRPTIRTKVKVPMSIPSISSWLLCTQPSLHNSSQFTSKFIIFISTKYHCMHPSDEVATKISTPNKHFQYATHRYLGSQRGVWVRNRHCLPSAMHQLINQTIWAHNLIETPTDYKSSEWVRWEIKRKWSLRSPHQISR